MKKYNDKSNSVRDWTTPKIESELLMVREQIESVDCFGINDLRFECALASELDRRAMLRQSTPVERLRMEQKVRS